jgi:hypothetical protein
VGWGGVEGWGGGVKSECECAHVLDIEYANRPCSIWWIGGTRWEQGVLTTNLTQHGDERGQKQAGVLGSWAKSVCTTLTHGVTTGSAEDI